jgi:hypothetical protein
LVVEAPPGLGKTSAAMQAITEQAVRARFVTSTTEKAREIVEDRAGHFGLVRGRDSENCANFPVVEAARAKGYEAGTYVCQRCPFHSECQSQEGKYYAQFTRPGSLVGAVEMLYSPLFLEPAELVVLDDADLERAMIETARFDQSSLAQLATLHSTRALSALLRPLHLLLATPSPAHPTKYKPKVGAEAWDILARAFGSGSGLADAIRAVAEQGAVAIGPKRLLTVEDFQTAPPAALVKLVATLAEELPLFLSGQEFNSGLSVTSEAIEIRWLRAGPRTDTGEQLLASKDVLVLDARPGDRLLEILLVHHEVERAPLDCDWPESARVRQVATTLNGVTSVRNPAGRCRVLRSLDDHRGRLQGGVEGAIVLKPLVADVVRRGIPKTQVANYSAIRGLNRLQDVDVLHLVGCPQPPDHSVLQTAHVLYKGQAFVSTQLVLRPARYESYQTEDGSGLAVDVLDFEDPRASALLRSKREDELFQAVHRARPLRRGSTDGELLVVIHTALPIPGVPVHEVQLPTAPSICHNDRLKGEAEQKVELEIRRRESVGEPLGRNSIQRATGVRPATVTKVLSRRKIDRPGTDLY